MKRLEKGLGWSFFDPSKVPSLPGLAGDAFQRAYEDFETKGLATSVTSASDLWSVICDAQRESGSPFMCYSDNINRMCFLSSPMYFSYVIHLFPLYSNLPHMIWLSRLRALV